MPKYLYTGSYTAEGIKGVIAEGGSGRKAAVEKMLASVDARLECLYFSMGADDFVAIIDGPDNVTAASVSMTVAASGVIKGRLTPLLTPEEIDKASKKSPAYRRPGA